MRRKNLNIFVLIFIFLSCIPITAKTIYIIKDAEGNNVAVTDVNYLTPEQIDKGYTITIFLESSKSSESSQPSNISSTKDGAEQQIEGENVRQSDLVREVNILELNSKYINKGSSIKVDGIIKNYGKYRIQDARISIECANESGKIISSQIASLSPSNIMPGEKAYFNAEIDNRERIISYKVFIFDKFLKVEYLNKLTAKVIVPNWSYSISKKGDYVCPDGRACFFCEKDGEFIILKGSIKNVGDAYMTKTDIFIIGRDFINRVVTGGSGQPKSMELAPGKTVNFSGILNANNKRIENFILEISWINPQGNKSCEQRIELMKS